VAAFSFPKKDITDFLELSKPVICWRYHRFRHRKKNCDIIVVDETATR